MLLLQQPDSVGDYFYTFDNGLNIYLQQQGNHPKYCYHGNYYYEKTAQLKKDIISYTIMQKESEVNRFGKSL